MQMLNSYPSPLPILNSYPSPLPILNSSYPYPLASSHIQLLNSLFTQYSSSLSYPSFIHHLQLHYHSIHLNSIQLYSIQLYSIPIIRPRLPTSPLSTPLHSTLPHTIHHLSKLRKSFNTNLPVSLPTHTHPLSQHILINISLPFSQLFILYLAYSLSQK
jgi:hypothetical protein